MRHIPRHQNLMYNTFGLFLHKVFASTLTRYLPPLFLIVHNPKMTVQPATNTKGLTPCLQKKNSQGYDSYDYQWCCEAPTTRVPPDTHPNALGKCWGSYLVFIHIHRKQICLVYGDKLNFRLI